MDDYIRQSYEKIKEHISEEEFMEALNDLREKYADSEYLSDNNYVDMIVGNFITEDVESIAKFNQLKINELEIGLSNISVIGRVMVIGKKRSFNTKKRSGEVVNIRVVDDTGSVRITLWSDNIKLLKNFNEGDIINVSNVYVKEGYNGALELSCKTDSNIEVVNDYLPDFPDYSEEITNIANLVPDSLVNMIVRIKKISDIKTFEKNGQENKVVFLDLQDETGNISYPLFGDDVNLIKQLKENDTVKLLNVDVIERNGVLSLSHHDGKFIKGNFDIGEFIEPVIGISDIKDGQNNVSVIAIVTAVFNVKEFDRFNGSKGKVRNIEIKDQTGSTRLTVWDKNVNLEFKKGNIIKIINGAGKFDDYVNKITINSDFNTSFDFNPEIDNNLIEFFNKCKDNLGPISINQINEFKTDGAMVDVIGRVIAIGDIFEFTRSDGTKGKVKSISFSDGEGLIRLSIWDEENFDKFEIANAYLIENGKTNYYKDNVTLNISNNSIISLLSDDQARFIPSFENIQSSLFEFKSIENIKVNDNNIMVVAYIIDSYKVHEFKKDDEIRYVRNLNITDGTGIIPLVLWGDDAKSDFNVSDIIKIQNPNVKLNNNNLELHLSSYSSILDVNDKEIASLPSFSEIEENIYPDKIIDEINAFDKNIKIRGILTSIETSRILITKCPICNSRLNETIGSEFFCDFCGELICNPNFLLMLKGKLDNSIDIVFFGDLVEGLIDLKVEEVINIVYGYEDISIITEKIKLLEGLNLEIICDVNTYNNQLSLNVKKVLSLTKIEKEEVVESDKKVINNYTVLNKYFDKFHTCYYEKENLKYFSDEEIKILEDLVIQEYDRLIFKSLEKKYDDYLFQINKLLIRYFHKYSTCYLLDEIKNDSSFNDYEIELLYDIAIIDGDKLLLKDLQSNYENFIIKKYFEKYKTFYLISDIKNDDEFREEEIAILFDKAILKEDVFILENLKKVYEKYETDLIEKYFNEFKTYYLVEDIKDNSNFDKNDLRILNKLAIKEDDKLVLNELKERYNKYFKSKQLNEKIKNLTIEDINAFKKKYFELYNEDEIFEPYLNTDDFTDIEKVIGKKLIKEQLNKSDERRKSFIFKNR